MPRYLCQKFRAYRHKGVQEYIVLLVHEKETRWFRWQEGEYVALAPNTEGILQSQVFPGLWLNSQKFWAGDLGGLLADLQKGIESVEHQTFVQKLKSQVPEHV